MIAILTGQIKVTRKKIRNSRTKDSTHVPFFAGENELNFSG